MKSDETPLSFMTPEGLCLSGVRWGAGAHQAVFTPGNGFPVECYHPALSTLAGKAEVHALNPRGFCASDIPPRFDGWESSLADLEAYIRTAMRPPVILAGHSFGAMLSLWLAAQAPELARGVLLLDPLVPVPREIAEPEGGSALQKELIERTRNRREHWPDREAAAHTLRGRGGYEGWRTDVFDTFLAAGLREAEEGGVRLACPSWLETRIYETLPKGKIWQWAQHVKAPTVVLRGQESEVAHGAALEELAEMLPIAAVAVVKGGHTFAQQHPDKAAEVIDFAWKLIMRAEPGGEITL